jgi:hypothetical protein
MRLPVAAALMACSTLFAQADPIDRCCMKAAAEKGHTGQAAACYASVCRHYVTMSADRRRCGTSGRAFADYRAALQSTCGISR